MSLSTQEISFLDSLVGETISPDNIPSLVKLCLSPDRLLKMGSKFIYWHKESSDFILYQCDSSSVTCLRLSTLEDVIKEVIQGEVSSFQEVPQEPIPNLQDIHRTIREESTEVIQAYKRDLTEDGIFNLKFKNLGTLSFYPLNTFQEGYVIFRHGKAILLGRSSSQAYAGIYSGEDMDLLLAILHYNNPQRLEGLFFSIPEGVIAQDRENPDEYFFWGREEGSFVVARTLGSKGGITREYYDTFGDLEKKYLLDPMKYKKVSPVVLDEDIKRILRIILREKQEQVDEFKREHRGFIYEYTPGSSLQDPQGNTPSFHPLSTVITGYYIYANDALSVVGNTRNYSSAAFSFTGEDADLALATILHIS